MRLLSAPVRLAPNGQLAEVVQGSDAHTAELVAALLWTRPGERKLLAEFGTSDPAYVGFDAAELLAGIARHGPDIQARVDARPVGADGIQRIDVAWSDDALS